MWHGYVCMWIGRGLDFEETDEGRCVRNTGHWENGARGAKGNASERGFREEQGSRRGEGGGKWSEKKRRGNI